MTLLGKEVKPGGDAYSLPSVDGAKSCSRPLSLRDERSLLKLLLGANEASRLPMAVCLLQFRKIVPNAESQCVLPSIYKVAKLSMW